MTTVDVHIKDDGRDKKHADDLLALSGRLQHVSISVAELVVGRVQCTYHSIVPHTHQHGRQEERHGLQQVTQHIYQSKLSR